MTDDFDDNYDEIPDDDDDDFQDEMSVDDVIDEWLADHGYPEGIVDILDKTQITDETSIRGQVFANIEDILNYLDKAPVLFNLAHIIEIEDLFYLEIPDDTSLPSAS